jgi:signal transduction histidine kinase
MNRNRLFLLTRWRLAGLYAGVMGVILGLCGLGFYQVMVRDRWQSLNHKLESVAGTLKDGLQPALRSPGEVAPLTAHYLPELCLANTTCKKPAISSGQHIAGTIQQNGYYIRFLDPSGRLIATAGLQPIDLPVQPPSASWQTLYTVDGTRYRQLSLTLKIHNRTAWGSMQVGQSLQEYDDHLIWLRLVLLLGLPVAMLFVSGASWWLAGLAMQPVYQSYQQIQQFTADAAHELRTPLAAIQTSIESSLQDDPLTPIEARTVLQVLDRQSQRLARLVQDLLLLSRVDLKGSSPVLQPCCLNELIEDLLEGFASLAIAHDLSLIPDIQVPRLVYVLGDEEQLYRLMANLVMNAIHYTPNGGKVILRLQQDETHAMIQVQDTGIGITPDDQRHIFDRFYRVNSDRSRQTGGSGLGLAIARAIAQTHRGSLQVHSEPGQGSTFTLRLPKILHSPYKSRLR